MGSDLVKGKRNLGGKNVQRKETSKPFGGITLTILIKFSENVCMVCIGRLGFHEFLGF